MTIYFCGKTLCALCTDAFGSLWTERLLHYYRNFMLLGMRHCRIPSSYFVNRMAAVRPSLFKDTGTLSAKAFGNE